MGGNWPIRQGEIKNQTKTITTSRSESLQLFLKDSHLLLNGYSLVFLTGQTESLS